MSLISPHHATKFQSSRTPLETDPYLMPRYYSEKLSSSGTKSPITTHLKTSLKHPNSPSCEDENLQSVKMLSEMLQKNQALKTPIKACYPSTNERANTEPSEYNFRISSQYQSTKPHYESNTRAYSSTKLNPYAPNSAMKSVPKSNVGANKTPTAENELVNLRKFLAEIQGMSGNPSPAQADPNVRHLCGVSPTRYRQQHVSSIKLNRLFQSEEEEEPTVRCFQEIADEIPAQKDFKEIIENQDRYDKMSTEEGSHCAVTIRGKNQLSGEDRLLVQATEKPSFQGSERESVSTISNTSSMFSHTTLQSRITALEGIVQTANNMIGHLESQLNLKNMKVSRLKETIMTKDQQIQHYQTLYEAEREKSLMLETTLKSETLRLNENIATLDKKLSDKQGEMEKCLSFMAKLQEMNNKLLQKIKNTERQSQLVSSKDKVIKRLEEMEQKLLQTKENKKLFNSSSFLSSTPQTDRNQTDSILKEINSQISKTATKIVDRNDKKEEKSELSQSDYKSMMSEFVTRYQRDSNSSSQVDN